MPDDRLAMLAQWIDAYLNSGERHYVYTLLTLPLDSDMFCTISTIPREALLLLLKQQVAYLEGRPYMEGHA